MKISNFILGQILHKTIFIFFFFLIFGNKILALENTYNFEINGNNNTDKEVILSIIDKIPNDLSEEYSNYLLNELNKSGLFKDIKIKIDNNKYYIDVIEYPIINKIYFDGNERFKDEELFKITEEVNFDIYNDYNTKNFINELKNLYSSFGYNNIKINLSSEITDQNLASIFIDIVENKITKIKSIKFRGNDIIASSDLNEVIKSKIKKITNIFANNNFKPAQVETDKQRLKSFYKNKGYADIEINYEIEFFENNSVIIYFNINEGIYYQLENVNFANNTSNENIDKILNDYFINNKFENKTYNAAIAESIEKEISNLIKISGIRFFEINNLVNLKEGKADLLYEIQETDPMYVNNININGNTRTLDYVVRRELDITEGDAFLASELNIITKKVQSLQFFEEVLVEKKPINETLVDIDINVKENQTGSFTAGASFGTLDGVTLVTGLNESNIAGTGRSLEFLINNSDKNNEYTFNTSDKFFLNRDMDLNYGLSYKERDYSKSSSYELEKYQISTGLSYKFQDNLYHFAKLSYELDDIYVTNSSTASSTIKDVQGRTSQFILENGITYSTLNSLFFPRNGNYLKFSNFVETPSSSKNGYIKNTITFKKYLEFNKDIASFQAIVGNIYSLNNSDILPNDKYSLGGRWLRGFDNFGAGPRNSRTSYIGGNNILATKIDYSKLLFNNDDNPIYLNFFNDIGTVWDNKNLPTYSNESIRSSAGFGLKFYSIIGPIAFTWGFPIENESYDIQRMFTFSVGNINW